MGFFKKNKDLKGTKSSKLDKEPTKEGPSVNQQYQKKLKEQNKKLDEMAEPETIKQILSLIESNINRQHFNEKKLPAFLEKCWQLQEPLALKEENERFMRFLYDDLKIILQCIDVPESIVGLMKLVVFFKVDDDPEIFDLLSDAILRKIRRLTVEDVLTVTVNFAHTLNPGA